MRQRENFASQGGTEGGREAARLGERRGTNNIPCKGRHQYYTMEGRGTVIHRGRGGTGNITSWEASVG